MKRSRICLVILGLWLCLGASSLAQAPPNFRIEFFTLPNANAGDVAYSVQDANNLGVVVGYVSSTVNEPTKAFVLDQNGVIGDQVPGKVYLLADLINIPPEVTAEYAMSQAYSINESSQVVGRLKKYPVTAPLSIGFFADLNDPESFEELPKPAPADSVSGIGINDHGDVLIDSWLSGEPRNYYIYNPMHPETDPVLLTDPVTNQPLEGIATGFNNYRQVVGLLNGGGYRLTPGISLETFSEFEYAHDINDNGQFCGTLDLSTDPDDKVFFRYTDTDPIELIGSEFNSGECKINSDGDVAMASRVIQSSPSRVSVLRDGHGLLDLDDLVVGEVDDLAFWDAATLYGIDINDRDAASGFGQIFGTGSRTTGRGRKQITEHRVFILTPIAPPAPDPGITVTPTNGLFTTEAFEGDPASFEVVLNTQPTADVTIGISSDNPNEGTTDETSLTFTPANWADAQTVFVFGVDDEDIDGNIAYTILTAAASSTDLDYSGMDPDDVAVTNLDDEQAPTVTYDSDDTPTPIPDRGMTDSTITTEDDFQIANMIVTLNISHQRSSDLDVYLIGANDEVVQLFNFNGDNNVADFNGTSTNGSWTLEVYDNRKKRTGDLNSWSMTVETN